MRLLEEDFVGEDPGFAASPFVEGWTFATVFSYDLI
jgi:hypothetical protein